MSCLGVRLCASSMLECCGDLASKLCFYFRLLNDVSIDPFASNGLKVREPNVAFWEVMYRGWPYMFVGSLTDICEGDELCIAYGKDYWEGMSSVICQAESVRRSLLLAVQKLALGARSQHSRAEYLLARCTPDGNKSLQLRLDGSVGSAAPIDRLVRFGNRRD